MILPKGHALTRRLIRYYHDKFFHPPADTTLFHLRSMFWVMGGKREVNNALNKCMICKKWNARLSVQQMAPLPEERVTFGHPFERIGVDFTGPFWIKEEDQEEEKVWIVLYVCMLTRAVHCDILKTLSTEVFLLTFRRLVARFGRPKLIWSDNARTFTKSAKEIQALWSPSSFKKLRNAVLIEGTRWRFISPASPWQGGMYERLVALVKKPLKKVFGSKIYDYETFRTNVMECEAVVNSRPLGLVSGQPEDGLPITPAMLAIGYNPVALTPSCALKGRPETPAGMWKRRLKTKQEFFERFVHDYILDLNKTDKWLKVKENLKVGDVVLVQRDDKDRRFWPLGVITQLIPSKEGLVRNVWLKTSKGFFRRSIQNLAPLEVSASEPIQMDLEALNEESED